MKKKIDFSKINTRPGDMVAVWGLWLISLLVGLKDGIKNPATHNAHFHTEETMASAELSGYKEVPIENLQKARRFKIYRFKKMTKKRLEKLNILTEEYFKKAYDIALYFIRAFQIMIVFVPFLFLLLLILKVSIPALLWISGGLLILYFPVMKILKELEKVTVACSEAEGELYSSIGLLKAVDDSTNLAPHIWHWILENRPDVKLIYDSHPNDKKKGIGN